MGDIVDGRKRYLHRELLRVGGRRKKYCCHDTNEESAGPAEDSIHIYFPPGTFMRLGAATGTEKVQGWRLDPADRSASIP
jgi:hypothetical protein